MKIPQPLVTVFLLLAVAGCSAPAAAGQSSVPPTGATTTATPSAAPLGADVILRVTAVMTAKTGGASVRIVETVRAPSKGDGTESAQMDAAQCTETGWKSKYPDPNWMDVELTSALVSGTAWPADISVAALTDGAATYPAWSGSVAPGQAYCSGALAVIPGSAHAVIPIDPAVPADNTQSWGLDSYGFAWAYEGDEPNSQPFTFTRCRLELGPAAAASPTVSAFEPATPTPGRDGYATQCSWGAGS